MYIGSVNSNVKMFSLLHANECKKVVNREMLENNKLKSEQLENKKFI